MIGAVLTAALLLAQASPDAAAAPAAASPPPAAAPASGNAVSPLTVTGGKPPAEDPHEVVCHSEVLLGSLFPKKVCASRQALTERKREDQAEVRRWQALRPYKSN